MKRVFGKFNRKQMLAFGLGLLVLVALLGGLLAVRPSYLGYREKVAAYQKEEADLNMYAQNQQEYDTALTRLLRVRSEWNDLYRRMPNISLKSPDRALASIWIEYGEQLGQLIWGWIMGRTGGFPQGISIPEPTVTPPTATTSLITVGLDGFGITARNFPHLLTFLRSMKAMPRLASIRSIKVEGQTQGTRAFLSVSIPVTIYLFTRDYMQGATQTAAAGTAGPMGETGVAAPAAGAPSAGEPPPPSGAAVRGAGGEE